MERAKTEEEWREELTPEQYHVLREQGTERPFSHEYATTKDHGVFRCAGCGAELFSSDAKFDSGTGWPSFREPAVAAAVELRPDHSYGMVRTEVSAGGAAATSGTCSTTARSRRASATASTGCAWSWTGRESERPAAGRRQREGLKVSWDTPSYGKFFYVTYPHWR